MAQNQRKQKSIQRDLQQESVLWFTSTQKERWGWSIIIGGGSLLVYILTLARTVAGGDSGELTTVAYTLGIAHPPGYPLYTLLGKIFSTLPIGSIAVRLNFMSAFFQSAATVFIFHSIARTYRNTLLGVLTAGLFAFLPIAWNYAIVAEVFSLNCFFLSLLINFLSLYLFHSEVFPEKKSNHYVYAMFITFGIGLSHHHTLLLLGGPILLSLFYRLYHQKTPYITYLKLCIASALGLSIYAYLPWTSQSNPHMAWGKIASFDEFFTHFSRAEYGTFALLQNNDKASAFANIGYYLHDVFSASFYIGLLLAFLGLYHFFKTQKTWAYTLFTCHTLYIAVLTALSNIPEFPPVYRGIITRFWIAPSIFLCLWTALGLIRLYEKYKVPRAAYQAISAFVIFQSLFFHYTKINQSHNTIVDQFGRITLNPLPPNSVLVVTNDVAYTVTRYLQLCENVRTDVTVLPLELMSYLWFNSWAKKYATDIIFPGDYYLPGKLAGYKATSPKYEGKPSYSLLDFLNENVNRRPLYLTHLIKPVDDPPVEKEFGFVPYGLTFKVVPKSQVAALDGKALQNQSFEILKHFDSTSISPIPYDSWEAYIISIWQDFLDRTQKMLPPAPK